MAEDNQTDDIGRYAKHPLRTMGAAFLAGTMLGMMAAKQQNHNKTSLQKFLDQLGM